MTEGDVGQWDTIASIATCTHDTVFDPAACLADTDAELCVDAGSAAFLASISVPDGA